MIVRRTPRALVLVLPGTKTTDDGSPPLIEAAH